jgi:8-oxo-dGTP pyrophosphatase MutT (NUDIX family)
MTLRDDALTVLSALPRSRLRDRYVEHVRTHVDAMYRTCSPDHVTASMLVLSDDHRLVLLTHHAKARQWFQFGGHCEHGDRGLAEAATREAMEESGLETLWTDPVPIHLDEHAVPFCDAGSDTHHLDVRFLGIASRDGRPVASDESVEVRWWPVDALPTDEPSMLALVAEGLGRAGQVPAEASAARRGAPQGRGAKP